MKNQLIHQTSCYDCGPTSITNAIRFLFEREEIPPVLLKHIWTMGLDAYADGGEPGKAGTSKASMRYMAAWFECFAEKCGFPLKATFLDMEFAAIQSGSLAWRCLERGGCAVVRVWHGKTGHYVLVTEKVSDAVVGLFDPFAEEIGPCEDYWPVSGAPDRKNREVRVEVLNRTDGTHYAMGALERREVLLLWRTDQ